MSDRDDIAAQAEAVRADLLALARKVAALAERYDVLDIASDSADAAAATEVIDSLSDAGLALNDALGHIDSAVWNARHLH